MHSDTSHLLVINDLLKYVQPRYRLYGELLLQNKAVNLLKYITIHELFGKHTSIVWFHIPNESINLFDTAKSKRYRLNQMANGLIPGAPDLVVMCNKCTLLIELKSDKGKQSQQQKLFQKWCDYSNIKYIVCKSILQLIDILKDNGIISENINIPVFML